MQAPDVCFAHLATSLRAVLFALLSTGPLSAWAVDDRGFAEAVTLFQGGHHAAAYARMMALANHGDPDAARIALFMHRYGAILYGTHWDASTDELADWKMLAASTRGRLPPAFQPLAAPKVRSAARKPAGARQTLHSASSK